MHTYTVYAKQNIISPLFLSLHIYTYVSKCVFGQPNRKQKRLKSKFNQ